MAQISVPMHLYTKSSWIFVLNVMLLVFVGLYPSPLTIGAAVCVGSASVLYQVFIVLVDKDPGADQ